MKPRILAAVPAALILASGLGCSSAMTVPGESSESVQSASTTGGISATLTVTNSGSTYSATMTVLNGSPSLTTNWQVRVNLGPAAAQNKKTIYPTWIQPAGAAGVNGAFYTQLGNDVLFTPLSSDATIPAGGSQVVTWSGDWNGATPYIVSVDGVASGTASASAPSNGEDSIARAAATAALSIAFDYEKNKLPNAGDSNYAVYDQLIWTAQSFRIASDNATIEYDPIAPGYAYVPNSVKADLAFAQLDPTVASYLMAGLTSCFSSTTGWYAYGFRADFLKGFSYPSTSSGSVTNRDGSVDYFTASGAAANGAEHITVTATSTTDQWFGVLTYLSPDHGRRLPSWPAAITNKFHGSAGNTGANPGTWPGHFTAGCTPFNGAGGSSNPYLVITQNGQRTSAWFQGIGTNCQNGCTGTLVADPIPYAEPGDYYTSMGLMGTQSNPFPIQSTLYADPNHASQWATRTANSIQEWGTFSMPITLFGTTKYKYVKQM